MLNIFLKILQTTTLKALVLKKAIKLSLTENQEDVLRKLLVKLGFTKFSIKVELPQQKGSLFVPALEYWRVSELSSGSFEPWLLNYLKPEEGGIAVDIGSHIGYHTLFLSKNVKESGKVVSIEPHPVNFQLLKRNLKENNCNNVVPIEAALSETNCYGKLYSAKYSSEYSINCNGQKKYLPVRVFSLDSLLETLHIDNVNLIKIDVEGAELPVLKGAEKTLTESKRLSIICEIHDPQTNNSDCAVCKYLTSKGFMIKTIKNLTDRRHIYAYK